MALPFAMAVTALLVVRKIAAGPGVRSPELVLDLYSVTCDGKTFNVFSSDVDESNGKGVGKNRRTAEFLGGGAALGALVGGIFGGGRGAGIGAASGAGGGFLVSGSDSRQRSKSSSRNHAAFPFGENTDLEPVRQRRVPRAALSAFCFVLVALLVMTLPYSPSCQHAVFRPEHNATWRPGTFRVIVS